jgi:hypothetical protein
LRDGPVFTQLATIFQLHGQTLSDTRINILPVRRKRLKSFFGAQTEREREPKFLLKSDNFLAPGAREISSDGEMTMEKERLQMFFVASFHFVGNSFRMNALCSFATGVYILYAHRHLFTFIRVGIKREIAHDI